MDSTPLIGALAGVTGLLVFVVREFITRHFKQYDELKTENAELKADNAKLTKRFDAFEDRHSTLQEEARETAAREVKERAAKEQALADGKTARDERDAARQDNSRLDKQNRELVAFQAEMVKRIETLEEDGRTRDREHAEALQAEVERREQAEHDAEESRKALKEQTDAMQKQIDDLTGEVERLKAAAMVQLPAPHESAPEPPQEDKPGD